MAKKYPSEASDDPLELYRLRQPIEELERKRKKAYRAKGLIWTQEDFDHSKKWAAEFGRAIGADWAKKLDY